MGSNEFKGMRDGDSNGFSQTHFYAPMVGGDHGDTAAESGANTNTIASAGGQKLDVTLIDAFRIKELNLLIFSYIFRQAHNTFIRQNDAYMAATESLQINYAAGAVIGVILAGIIADLFLQNKRFLTILFLNMVLLFWDFYLISDQHSHKDDSKEEQWLFFVTLGAILASNDLIYLILIPMLIAKNHSEKMAQLSRY
jgi:hypothetical protein